MKPEAQQLEVNGVRLPFVDVGTGPAVVFVHGSITDHRFWEPQWDGLRSHLRCIAPSQRHYGADASQETLPRNVRELHVGDLIAFVSRIGTGPVHLVGTSYGGEIVLAAAARRPDLVRSVLVNEPSAPWALMEPEDAATFEQERGQLGPAVAALKAGRLEEATALFVDWTTDSAGEFATLSPSLQDLFLANARTLPGHLSAHPLAMTAAEIGMLAMPVTLTMGSRTRPLFRVVTRAVHRCLPRSRLIEIAGARHAAPLEVPTLFNAVVMEHIERCTKATTRSPERSS